MRRLIVVFVCMALLACQAKAVEASESMQAYLEMVVLNFIGEIKNEPTSGDLPAVIQ